MSACETAMDPSLCHKHYISKLMKYRKIVIVALALSMASCSTVPTKRGGINDEILASLITGSWIVDPREENSLPSRHVYNSDHTMDFVAYASFRCDEPIFHAKAHWRIEGKKLISVVRSSSNETLFPAGYVVEDEIVAIDNHSMVLKNASGKILHRLKRYNCAGGRGMRPVP